MKKRSWKRWFSIVFSLAMLCGVVWGNAHAVKAANYAGTNGGDVKDGFTLNNDGSVTATFTVTDNGLDMRGWLLCLMSSSPNINDSNKLTDSNDAHPSSYNNCAHYFVVADTTATGTISVTWPANAVDQKTNWSSSELTSNVTGSGITLSECLAASSDWYIVIGPRHYNTGWGNSGIGAGTDGYWENCDLYIGTQEQVFSSSSGTGNTTEYTTGLFAGKYGKYQVFDVQRSPDWPSGTQANPSSFTVSSFTLPCDASRTHSEPSDDAYFYFKYVGKASDNSSKYSAWADNWQGSDSSIDPCIFELYLHG